MAVRTAMVKKSLDSNVTKDWAFGTAFLRLAQSRLSPYLSCDSNPHMKFLQLFLIYIIQFYVSFSFILTPKSTDILVFRACGSLFVSIFKRCILVWSFHIDNRLSHYESIQNKCKSSLCSDLIPSPLGVKQFHPYFV